MVSIEISKRQIGSPGLYIMRWQNRTGLVRIVGEFRKGFRIIAPKDAPETYMAKLPKDGQIPDDALFSEPLSIVVV